MTTFHAPIPTLSVVERAPGGADRTAGKETSVKLELQPLNFGEACAFVLAHHRHHRPPIGHKFSIGVNDGSKIVGVIIVGRPVSRHLDDTWTMEVTLCSTDWTPHVASKLYAAAWRACRAMGYKRLITYSLATETGTSLKAAGWRIIGSTPGRSWSCPARPRIDHHPLGQKTLWEAE